MPATVSGQAERTIVYTGSLESDGAAVNATTDLNFALFACEAPDGGAGCARPLWVADGAITSWDTSTGTPFTAQWPAGGGIATPIQSGRFSVRLGGAGQNALPTDLFDEHEVLFLAIQVGTTPLTSLQRIETVPFAVRALDSPDLSVELLRVSTLGLEIVDDDGNSLLLLAEDGDLDVLGGVQVGDSDACTATDEGRLRWRDGALEVCDGGEYQLAAPPRGVVYTHWGRSDCPADAELVYSGGLVTGHYDHPGGVSSQICLTDEPSWEGITVDDTNQDGALLYGNEYQIIGGNSFPGSANNYDPVCAVCLRPTADVQVMVPGSTACPAGWQREYFGYLMGAYYAHPSSHDLICVNASPELRGPNTNHEQALLYTAETECSIGNFYCSFGYVHDREVGCAVCTR